jgi:hypothetical protein
MVGFRKLASKPFGAFKRTYRGVGRAYKGARRFNRAVPRYARRSLKRFDRALRTTADLGMIAGAGSTYLGRGLKSTQRVQEGVRSTLHAAKRVAHAVAKHPGLDAAIVLGAAQMLATGGAAAPAVAAEEEILFGGLAGTEATFGEGIGSGAIRMGGAKRSAGALGRSLMKRARYAPRKRAYTGFANAAKRMRL